MKLSAGAIGTLLFTAVATAAFVWMAKRPAVDGNAMSFGMPTQQSAAATPTSAEPESKPEATKTEEANVETEEAAAPEKTSTEEASPEKVEAPTEKAEPETKPEEKSAEPSDTEKEAEKKPEAGSATSTTN